MDIPFSDLASPEARAHRERPPGPWEEANARLGPDTDIAETRRLLDELYLGPGLERLRSVFDVTIEPKQIEGVPVDVVRPAAGVSGENADRVLINLHGGAFAVGGGIGGQQESVPIAALAGVEVVTVDYRQGPEHAFPAASEDVATVYRSLLERYAPERIGIYGCSAGGSLTAASIPWFDSVGLPHPGALGVFGFGGSVAAGWGDSAHSVGYLEGTMVGTPATFPYFAGADLRDPRISPEEHDEVLAGYPPTLVISGTRDALLSRALRFHARLVRNGVETRLHVWEGLGHCSFAQGPMDPGIPELREVWDVVVRFFAERFA